jgi:hypothetical protein
MSFNLVDQPWLPCWTAAGETRLFGLRNALAGSHGIRELRDGSPKPGPDRSSPHWSGSARQTTAPRSPNCAGA